jgi:NADH:ubiquinone oxidoreductase subunit K
MNIFTIVLESLKLKLSFLKILFDLEIIINDPNINLVRLHWDESTIKQ